MKNLKLTCIKECAVDPEQYGVDFLVGKSYEIQSVEKDGSSYVESESGPDVLLSNKEMREVFGISLYRH